MAKSKKDFLEAADEIIKKHIESDAKEFQVKMDALIKGVLSKPLITVNYAALFLANNNAAPQAQPVIQPRAPGNK